MSRIVLVHWNAEEAEERARRLETASFAVSCHVDPRAAPTCLREDPPDAFVIDLARLPSQGREVGGWLRRQKATRAVPLVFVGGDPEKTARVRALLPDATFTSWERVAEDLAAALSRPLRAPVVPGAMDAYSGVPLTKKLGISPDAAVVLIEAPPQLEGALRPFAAGGTATRADAGRADVIVWFVTSSDALDDRFAQVATRMEDRGRLWIAWPKKASGVASNLSQTVVRAFGLARGFVDYKIASIDETWSALCFARRASGNGDVASGSE